VAPPPSSAVRLSEEISIAEREIEREREREREKQQQPRSRTSPEDISAF
jgi:hypothetical protein